MSIKNRILAVTAASSVALGSLAPLSGSALADGWGDGNAYRGSYDRDWNTGYDRRYRGFEHYRNPDHGTYRRHAWREERDRREEKRDRKVARGIAIGLGVLMLGLIAAEADRGYDRYDSYDY
jgi:hypothetical protein